MIHQLIQIDAQKPRVYRCRVVKLSVDTISRVGLSHQYIENIYNEYVKETTTIPEDKMSVQG